jgi:trans-aconitate methyltransferase
MPAVAVYRPLVDAAGLEVTRLDLVQKDVAHDGQAGLAGWVRTTWMPYTDRLPPDRRGAWIDEVVAAYTERMPPDEQGRLHVPSFRIELEARRPD